MHSAILRGYPALSTLAALVVTLFALTLVPVTAAGSDSSKADRHHFCPPLC